ncbi:hypothetical protein EXIGLDRAFT_607910 [Exidia glandulosa HHB12029]|uniref:Uncharacterized protein n=1 Tax=Exidia glandulosa HHB12029 TaxID=1314781 RepID=A0A165L9C3_EXIGL|nr:hypothetical protein EXIGLDRAFT_607910 [Exidia glandulosa HHB12029]
MSHFSPPTILLWAILAVLLQTFLVTHLWKFDRFQCLRWNAGKQPGAFQRVMTYTYLATMPLLVFFSVAMTIIKYKEGACFASFSAQTGPIIPKPFELWDKTSYDFIFPLYLVFAVAWSFEMVTHLEGPVFLINQGERQRTWFGSPEFQWWLIGSMTAVVAMPCVAIFTRQDLLRCEAWIFFIGSIGSTFITILFLYVLWRFPAFLQGVRAGGAPPQVVVRLSGFHEINIIRVGFRFMFTLPLFILAVDGIRNSQHHPINDSSLTGSNRVSVDLLGALGGVGCMVSSTLTLLVFFPRSRTEEAGYDPREPSTSMNKRTHSGGTSSTRTQTRKGPPLEPIRPVSPMSPYSDDDDVMSRSPVAVTPSEESPTHHLQLQFRHTITPEPTTPTTTTAQAFDSAVPLQEMSSDAVGRRRIRTSRTPHEGGGGLHPLVRYHVPSAHFCLSDRTEQITSYTSPISAFAFSAGTLVLLN